MRTFFGELEKEAKEKAPGKVDLCIVIIIDFAQNLDLPSFRSDQPGETYYYSVSITQRYQL